MKYMIRANTTIDDFASIVPLPKELENTAMADRAFSFKQAKKELIKIYFQRINAVRKMSEKEYFNANNRNETETVSGSDRQGTSNVVRRFDTGVRGEV